MGNCCPIVRFRRRPSAVNPKSITLLLVGLDNAGKTTIAKRLSEEPLDGVLPTVGFSKVTLQEKGCSVTVYDLGGGPQIRDIWPRYYADVHGVIFVIDASDVVRMNECRKALEGILLDRYISGKPILLLANKQDVEGALDEIDIVDCLNVERLVNQQKCPTLVELCSARHFSRKMDVGIDNGYKWLLRCISKDYPSLNNRVLKDLATQEELERINRIQTMERIRRRQQQERDLKIRERIEWTSVEPVPAVKDDKPHQNGVIKMVDDANIPGQIEDRLVSPNRGKTATKVARSSSSSDFSSYERDNSDVQLIQNIEKSCNTKNFLVRPKSSGPRLNTVRSGRKRLEKAETPSPLPRIDNKTEKFLPESTKKKAQRRRSYHRNNKTAPNQMVEVSLEPLVPLPRVFHPEYRTDVKPFSEPNENEENLPPEKDPSAKRGAHLEIPMVSSAKVRIITVAEGQPTSKSTPNSRKTSAKSASKRCSSSEQVSDLSKLRNLPPLKKPGRGSAGRELILDVTQLDD